MTADEIARVLVKPALWVDEGGDDWSLSCPTTGEWYALSSVQRDRFEKERRALIADTLSLDLVAQLVEAAVNYKEARLKVDDTPEFCAMVEALAPFREAP